jgi:hypothetical protein
MHRLFGGRDVVVVSPVRRRRAALRLRARDQPGRQRAGGRQGAAGQQPAFEKIAPAFARAGVFAEMCVVRMIVPLLLVLSSLPC